MYYDAAIQVHPTQVKILADYALVLAEAGEPDEAQAMARKALKQDELNHLRGHTERYLAEDLVRKLQEL